MKKTKKKRAKKKAVEDIISEEEMLSLVREHHPYDDTNEDTMYSEYHMMCMGYDVAKIYEDALELLREKDQKLLKSYIGLVKQLKDGPAKKSAKTMKS